MVASVPEDTNRTISSVGTAATSCWASRSSTSVGAPKDDPSAAARVTASTTCGCACPAISGPQESTQSTYRLPSTSNTHPPSPRATNSGYSRPTDRIARTGLETPPGIDPFGLGEQAGRLLGCHRAYRCHSATSPAQ